VKRPQRSAWLPTAAAAAVLVAILLVLYSKTQDSGESSFARDFTVLRHVKQLDAQWELNVLKSRVGANPHYDRLADIHGQIDRQLEQFESNLQERAQEDPALLSKSVTALREQVAEKADLIEQFKSSNSVLRNSFVFLPTAVAELDQTLSADERAVLPVQPLLLASVLYGQSPSVERRVEVDDALLRLVHAQERLDPPSRERVRIVANHVAMILSEQPVLDGLMRRIAAVPTAARIDDIASALAVERQIASKGTERYRQWLLAFSVVLSALFLAATVRLVSSHALIKKSNEKLLEYGHGLERLVCERVAALRESEARMTQLAKYDALTGLPNRSLFRERLGQAMIRADRETHLMGLMFVDLDHFKQINDSLGHVVGDGVLKAVAIRLQESLRENDTIARLGGDEFTIILEGLAEPSDVHRVAAKIKSAMARPLLVDGREFVVSASIGVALYPSEAQDGDMLLKAADIAMYQAKASGRNAHRVFAPEMATEIDERVRMASLLRTAIERDELEVVYQPKLDLSFGRIAGVEALVRWNSRELGPVSPTRFIPLAEEMGLIISIGDWVLSTACEQGAAWNRKGLELTMAVNLSPIQLQEPDLVRRIADILERTAFPAGQLELELTEGVIMENVSKNIQCLAAMRELGAGIAVDDFGTGYSSLAYLTRLPVQTLKIDRAFVSSMLEDANAMTLVSTIVTLAHSLGLTVVAEGVETGQQQRILDELDCDQIQGYHLSKPVSAEAIEELIARTQSRDRRTLARYAERRVA